MDPTKDIFLDVSLLVHVNKTSYSTCSHELVLPNIISIITQKINISNLLVHHSNLNRRRFFGDFNAILGSHEHHGISPPTRSHMADFQAWVSHNSLIDLLVNKSFFTWNNSIGHPPVVRRLDRFYCNQNVLAAVVSVSASTLSKTRSDHFPILLDTRLTTNKFA